jgi:hypothetical protein
MLLCEAVTVRAACATSQALANQCRQAAATIEAAQL